MKIIVIFFAIFLLLPFGSAQSSNPAELKVGIISTDRPPYFWHDEDGKLQGIFIRLLDEISKNINIPINYQLSPQSRLRLLMNRGAIDIEPGIDKSWRVEPGEIPNSVYSIPFLNSSEVWIAGPNIDAQKIGKNGDPNLFFCGVDGFNHLRIQYKDVAYLQSEKQVLERLNTGQCGYSIIPYPVFHYFNEKKDYNLTVSSFIQTYHLRLRLNKKHEHLLPEINRTITQMLKKGHIPIYSDTKKSPSN